ncbi:enoyl-CoA hydratase [Colwellia sp. MEBiC06753]
MDNLILTNEASGILTITLNRLEKKNALITSMYNKLCELFNYASNESSIRCVVIQGSTECFSAGNDVGDFLNSSPDEELAAVSFIKILAKFEKPIVAAVAGPAVGIGTTLLLHSDVVIAADNAKFALIFTQIGLCPEAGSSIILPQLIGHVKAFELLVLGESFNAETALSLNLITKIVDKDKLFDTAQQYANRIAQLPQQALSVSRQLLKQANASLLEQTMTKEVELFTELLQTDDCKTILSKFLGK